MLRFPLVSQIKHTNPGQYRQNFVTLYSYTHRCLGRITAKHVGLRVYQSYSERQCYSHNPPTLYNDEGCRRSYKHVVSSCRSHIDTRTHQSQSAWSVHCHSPLSRSGGILNHMEQYNVKNSVFHKMLFLHTLHRSLLTLISPAQQVIQM